MVSTGQAVSQNGHHSSRLRDIYLSTKAPTVNISDHSPNFLFFLLINRRRSLGREQAHTLVGLPAFLCKSHANSKEDPDPTTHPEAPLFIPPK